MLEIVEANSSSAQKNMEKDIFLLQSLEENPRSILHFYNWESLSVTYGYFTNPSRLLYTEQMKKEGIDLAKRPTGGGVIFHIWDLAFSLLVPRSSPFFSENTLQNYAFVHKGVFEALSSCFPLLEGSEMIEEDFEAKSPFSSSFCMAKPTKYDLVYRGKKLAGAAQRKTRFGFLHQGSLSLFMPEEEKLKRWVKDSEVISSIMNHSYFFEDTQEKEKIQDRVKASLINTFSKKL